MDLVITDAARALIGVESPPITHHIERSWLKHFAQSIYWPATPNPLYFDEEYAKKTPFGDIIAAPTFATRVRWMGGQSLKVNDLLGPPTVGMNGGSDYEILKPIRPGDVLTARGHLASLKESPRPDGGVLVIVRFAGRVDNQKGERVLNTGSTGLRIYGPHQVRKS